MVSLQVKVDGALVEWESNGYIPLLSGAEKAEIRLTCGKGIWGFNVAPYNPNKKATPEKPSVPKEVTGAKNYSKSDDRNIYHKTVHIENGAQTNYPVNCIRLLRLDECNSNEVDLTEIGITFQRQRGYLTVQDDVYKGWNVIRLEMVTFFVRNLTKNGRVSWISCAKYKRKEVLWRTPAYY